MAILLQIFPVPVILESLNAQYKIISRFSSDFVSYSLQEITYKCRLNYTEESAVKVSDEKIKCNLTVRKIPYFWKEIASKRNGVFIEVILLI